MKGYYKKPQETAEAFTTDGFLKTGDAGEFDANGNLYITDRIKELMKTSNDKYIAPQMLESKSAKINSSNKSPSSLMRKNTFPPLLCLATPRWKNTPNKSISNIRIA